MVFSKHIKTRSRASARIPRQRAGRVPDPRIRTRQRQMLVALHTRLQRRKAAPHQALPHTQNRLGRLLHIDAQPLRQPRRAGRLLLESSQRPVPNAHQTVRQSNQLRWFQGRLGRGSSQHQARPAHRRWKLRRGVQRFVARSIRCGH